MFFRFIRVQLCQIERGIPALRWEIRKNCKKPFDLLFGICRRLMIFVGVLKDFEYVLKNFEGDQISSFLQFLLKKNEFSITEHEKFYLTSS